MKNTILLTQNILGRMMKKPLGLIIRTLIITSLFFVFLWVYNFGEDSTIHIGVADSDSSSSSRYIINHFRQIDGVEVYTMSSGELDYYVTEGELPMGIYIPRGYQDSLLDGEPKIISIQTIFSPDSMIWGESVIENLNTQLLSLSQTTQGDRETYLDQLKDLKALTTSTEIVEDRYQNDTTISKAFGVYLLLVMLSTMTLAFKIVEEKNKGTFDRIGYSPVNSMYMTIANIIANLLIATVQLVLMIVLLQVLPWWRFDGNVFVMFLVLFTFTLCAVSFGVFIASISKTVARANEVLAFTLAPTCMIGGCLWPVDMMPDFMQRVALLTPQRWTMAAIDIVLDGMDLERILPSLAVVLMFTVLFGLIASRRFIQESR